jgi:hypothetical protein
MSGVLLDQHGRELPPSSRPDWRPWLAHLRTDRRGLPVPWVNAWGTEVVERMAVRRDPWCARDAMYEDDEAETVPDFTRQSMQRQRESMLRGMCQVCARPVPWSRRWLVVTDVSVQPIRLDGRTVPVITEPWLCERCKDIAVSWCPALIRRTRADRLTAVPITSKRQVELVLSFGWLDGQPQTKVNNPVMWVKVALLDTPIVLIDEHTDPHRGDTP